MNARRWFLGLENMSRDDQLRVGLTGIILLSLECVLAGLVTDAPVRGWIIHALAAGMGIWALKELSTRAIRVVRAAGAAGVAAVANEALMIAETNQSMKYLLPGSLLLVVSIIVLQRTLDQRLSAVDNPVASARVTETSLSTSAAGINDERRLLAICVGVVGAITTLYGLMEAEYVLVRALFGLIRERLAFADLQAAWQDLGTPSAVSELMVSGAQYLGYLGVVVAVGGVFGTVSRLRKVSHGLRLTLTAVLGGGVALNLLVVAALVSASNYVVVLGGAWLAPIGLALLTYAFWSTTDPR